MDSTLILQTLIVLAKQFGPALLDYLEGKADETATPFDDLAVSVARKLFEQLTAEQKAAFLADMRGAV